MVQFGNSTHKILIEIGLSTEFGSQIKQAILRVVMLDYEMFCDFKRLNKPTTENDYLNLFSNKPYKKTLISFDSNLNYL